MNRPALGRLSAWILALSALLSPFATAQEPAKAPARRPFAKAGTPLKPERARAYDVRHVRGDLRFDTAAQEVRGKVAITLAPLSYGGGQSVTLDCGAGLKVAKVEIADKPCRFEHRGDELFVMLDRPYRQGEPCTIAVTYSGGPSRGLRFIPPSPDFPGRKAVAWTVGEPEDAHHWIPCYDAPNDKFTAEMVVTVDRPLMAVSNGDLVSSKENPDGTSTFHWKIDRELTSYLLSIDIAEFHVFRDKLGDLPVDYYVLKEVDEETARRVLGKTPKMIEFFNKAIGTPYAFNRYAQVCIPEFGGGMEHTSKTTLTDTILVDAVAHRDNDADSLVAHELAHQWFGDLITCRDWPNLWLNEGFASYFDALFTEHDRGEDAFRLAMADNLSGYISSDREYRRPILEYRYDDPWSVFDSVTYAKGACVLHALRGLLGDDAWWKGIRDYVASHKGKNVKTDDFREAMEKSSGKDLGWFFDQWVSRGGHPELKASWRYEADDKTARIRVEQVQQSDDTTPVFRLPTTIELADESGVRSIPVVIDGRTHEFILPAPSKPKMVRIDPKGWLPKTIDFPKPAEEWTYQLEHSADVMGRIGAASALASKYAGDATAALLAKAWAKEKDPKARASMVRHLGSCGEAARAGLLAAAKDREPGVRSAAFSALASLKFDPELESLFRSAWADKAESYRVRASALRALEAAKVKDREDLLKAAFEDPSGNRSLGQTALGILLGRGGQEAREAAATYAAPGQPLAFRSMAAGSLAKVAKDDPRAERMLVGLLDDPALNVRAAAANALLDNGSMANLAKIEAALAHIDGPARPAIEARLNALKEPKKPAGAAPPREAADLDRQAAELELKARELRNRAEALRIEAERKAAPRAN
ncbi:MAG: M1 family aminopeptidase [Isosphaeraceae bacterium]